MKVVRLKFFVSILLIFLLLVGCSANKNSLEEEKEGTVEEVNNKEEPIDKQEQESETDEETESNIEEDPRDEDVQAEQAEEQDVDNRSASYLMDKTNDYVKEVINGGQILQVITTYVGEDEGEGSWDLWETTIDGETHEFAVKEDEEGLYTGYPESEYYVDLVYPLEEGKTFENWGEVNTITKIDGTMTTEAGEFDHVVEVKTADNWTLFFAPTIGHIRSVDENGTVVSELIEIIPQ